MKLKQLNRKQRGFTLLELLVVLVILGLLAGVAGPKIWETVGKSKPKVARIQIDEFDTCLDMFRLDTGRYPTTQEGLQALITQPPGVTGWAGPYLRKPNVPKDPWDNDYRYVAPGQHGGGFDISSLGADKTEGGDGENKDVNSWER